MEMADREMIDPKEVIAKKNDVSTILNDTFDGYIDGIVGITSSTKKEIISSLGYLIKKMRVAKFGTALTAEWKSLKERGKIKSKYEQSDQALSCLQEMMDFLDNDGPDETRYQVMRALYLAISTEEKSDRFDPVPYQLMKICRKLSSEAVLLLHATYRIYAEGNYNREDASAVNWLLAVTSGSGLKYRHLIEKAENELMEAGILDKRHLSDGSAVLSIGTFRLTELGIGLCVFIEHYEKSVGSADPKNQEQEGSGKV